MTDYEREIKTMNDAYEQEAKEVCNCSKCELTANNCVHYGCYRRLPQVLGGLGLCKNLKK